MKKRTLILALTAILLVCTATAGTAFAYFTTYARATGGYVIELGDQTTIDDDVSNWVKHVKITVSDDSQPVFVRARAFGPTDYELQYSGSEKWAPGGDGYYYYQEACTAGQQLDELNIRIANVPEQKDIVKPEEFNEEKKDWMRAQLFDAPQLKECLNRFDNPEDKQREYLQRLCTEYVELFLEGSNQVMGNIFGFHIERNKDKRLAVPVAHMIERIRTDKKLSPEQREQLWKAMYQGYAARTKGNTEYLDEQLK